MVRYRFIAPDDVSGSALAELIDMLPAWRREEALRFKHEGGRRECALSYQLLCDMLSECWGIAEQPQFVKGQHGKPALSFCEADNNGKYHFNISHCKNAIACIVSDEGEVGIDVERLGRYNKTLAEYCMSVDEVQRIEKSDDKDAAFALLWTKKEALLKYTGEGITDDIKACLASERMEGITMESGCDKEKGYAWTLVAKGKDILIRQY